MSPPLPPRPAKTLVVTPSEPPPLPARHSLASVLQEQPERTASPVPSIEHERDYVPIESNATQPLDAPTTLFAERSLSDDPQGVLNRFVAPAKAADQRRNLWYKPSQWIHLIAQKHPPETLEGKILRESVEAEEIRRYMDNFHKYVDYLQLKPKSSKPPGPPEPLHKPSPLEFKRKKPISVQVQETDGNLTLAEKNELANNLEKEKGEEEEGKDRRGKTDLREEEVDWFAYYMALTIYKLNLHTPMKIQPSPVPSPQAPEFTVSRFKSAGTRFYVAAKGPWERFAIMLGGVVMWDSPQRTMKWMGTYLILTITSTFLPFFLAVSLYYLVLPRFSSQSEEDLQKALLEDLHRRDEGEAFVLHFDSNADKGSEHDHDSDHESNDLDLLDQAKDLSSKINSAAGNAAKKITKNSTKKISQATGGDKVSGSKKLLGVWEVFQKEHGAQIVLILNDLADMHEKMINLFGWKRPEASVKAAMGLFIGIFVTYATPTWVVVKGIEMAIFAVIFIVIPVLARLPSYQPFAWLMGDAPTDKEHALELMRKYNLEGKVWKESEKAKPPKTPKTVKISKGKKDTDSIHNEGVETESIISEPINNSGRWADMNDRELGGMNKGASWLEAGRSILQGEKRLDLSFIQRDTLPEEGEASADVVAAKRMSLGSLGAGIVLKTKTSDSPYTMASTSYLAHRDGSTGTLFISQTGLRFAPFIAGTKKKDKEISSPGAIDPLALSTSPGSSILETGMEMEHDPTGVIVNGKELRIPMLHVSGVRKVQKTALGVTISTGLEIETVSAGKFNFPFIANRDEAFNRLLAAANRALEEK